MKDRHGLMPILRLAYSTQFLIALIAVFVLWSQVGGQTHLDLLPWTVKLGLGLAAAYGVVRATAASVSGDRAWNGQTVRWLGLTLAVLGACGYASYYAHLNLEDTDDSDQQQDTTVSQLQLHRPYNSVRLESALRLARSAPTSVTTMRSPS
jgi:predicted outer membrane lipoprotein